MKKQISSDEHGELKSIFEQCIENNQIVLKAYQELDLEHPIVQSMWNNFLIKQKLASEYHDFENYKHLHSRVVQSSTP